MGCRGGSIVDLIVQDEVDCKLLVATSPRQSALNKRFIESKRANCRHGRCRRQFALQVSGDHVVCVASLTTGLPVFDLENRDCFSEEDECHCRRSTRERVLDENTDSHSAVFKFKGPWAASCRRGEVRLPRGGVLRHKKL